MYTQEQMSMIFWSKYTKSTYIKKCIWKYLHVMASSEAIMYQKL